MCKHCFKPFIAKNLNSNYDTASCLGKFWSTREYSNPELSTEQMNLIDKAIQELKFKSK